MSPKIKKRHINQRTGEGSPARRPPNTGAARQFGSMTQLPAGPDLRRMWKPVIWMLIRLTITVAVMLAAYARTSR